MANKFPSKEEKSLDAWIDDTIAVIDDQIYLIMIQINLVLKEVMTSVR